MKKIIIYLLALVVVLAVGFAAYDYAVNDRGYSVTHGKSSSPQNKGSLGMSNSWMN